MISDLSKMFELYAEERGFGPRIFHIQDIGFATYHLNKEECYIEDIYVVESLRKSKFASKMADAISEIAKKNGINKLIGSVSIYSKGCENSIKVLLAYGMKPVSTSNEMIYFSKEL